MIYKMSIKQMVIFEIKSAVGRFAKLDRPKLFKDENYLNIGCGSNHMDGFINANFFPGLRFWRLDRKLEWYLDLRYPLNCEDCVFDGVFTEHTLEHLYPDDAVSLLEEIFRIMKTGALIRVTVPDLEKYVSYYTGKMEGEERMLFEEKFPTGASAIRNLSQNFFHLSLWDFEELQRCMERIGFCEVQKMAYGNSSNDRLCLDLEGRSWETLYVEARKPE